MPEVLMKKQPYILTDGASVADRQLMTKDECDIANEGANIASDGTWLWVIDSTLTRAENGDL